MLVLFPFAMITINPRLSPVSLQPKLDRLFALASDKVRLLESEYDTRKGSPVFTVQGKYTTRGWTEWTQGFQFGCAILAGDVLRDDALIDFGRRNTVDLMAPHLSHVGVHDHGFNNVSTYGNLRRLLREGRLPANEWELNFYEVALKVSGAVQARRWSHHHTGGYLYSFNGPHSLFVDTIRSCRALVVSHLLGHALMEENDLRVNLLERALAHAKSTGEFSVFHGEGRDSYDMRGRTAHECIFNVNDGAFRCPNSQQGYTGFSTWTRGLAWAMCGFSELLELVASVPDADLESSGGRAAVEAFLLKSATATCDFYIANSPVDGIPYWDTGAPELHRMGDYLDRASDPFNEHEPVDSSAAAIGAQGLVRLGRFLQNRGDSENGVRYFQAGLTVLESLFQAPYLSEDAAHQGLILHSVYHRPNGWDYIPPGRKVPCGESSMWGDYHAIEAALLVRRLATGEPYYTFFS